MNDDLTYSIEGVAHDPTVYTIDFAAEAEPAQRLVFNPYKIPTAVTGLKLVERHQEVYGTTGVYFIFIDVGWTIADAPNEETYGGFEIYYRVNGTEAWVLAAETKAPYYSIGPVVESTTYNVAVVAKTPAIRAHSLDNATTGNITTT
jgi:hypothetical protein